MPNSRKGQLTTEKVDRNLIFYFLSVYFFFQLFSKLYFWSVPLVYHNWNLADKCKSQVKFAQGHIDNNCWRLKSRTHDAESNTLFTLSQLAFFMRAIYSIIYMPILGEKKILFWLFYMFSWSTEAVHRIQGKFSNVCIFSNNIAIPLTTLTIPTLYMFSNTFLEDHTHKFRK